MTQSETQFLYPTSDRVGDYISLPSVLRQTSLETTSVEPITATGRPRMAFHFGNLPTEVIKPCGQQANVSQMDLLGQMTSAGLYSSAEINVDSLVVEIDPLLLRRLCPNTPAWTLTNRRIPMLENFNKARDLYRSLATAPPKNRRAILQTWFDSLEPGKITRLAQRTLTAIYRERGAISVRLLADEFDVSTRTLQLTFRDEIGIPPKLFCSQIRCQLAAQSCGPQRTNSRIAVDHEYYDQPHMNRDFQRFLGMTPIETARSGYASTRVL